MCIRDRIGRYVYCLGKKDSGEITLSHSNVEIILQRGIGWTSRYPGIGREFNPALLFVRGSKRRAECLSGEADTGFFEVSKVSLKCVQVFKYSSVQV